MKNKNNKNKNNKNINNKKCPIICALSSKSKIIYLILGLIFIAIAAFLFINRPEPPQQVLESPAVVIALIETNKGDIKIELFNDMPITVNNFVSLAQKGFYDGLIFHRVINGFMIQGGCPYGTGFGGPGHTIKCEFKGYNRNTRGTISMANAGPNTGGSQFFINLVDNHFLNNRHAVFGRVVKGMEVVDAIGRVGTGTGVRPIKDVVIKNIEIIKTH